MSAPRSTRTSCARLPGSQVARAIVLDIPDERRATFGLEYLLTAFQEADRYAMAGGPDDDNGRLQALAEELFLFVRGPERAPAEITHMRAAKHLSLYGKVRWHVEDWARQWLRKHPTERRRFRRLYDALHVPMTIDARAELSRAVDVTVSVLTQERAA